jgi:hypothetical protein
MQRVQRIFVNSLDPIEQPLFGYHSLRYHKPYGGVRLPRRECAGDAISERYILVIEGAIPLAEGWFVLHHRR